VHLSDRAGPEDWKDVKFVVFDVVPNKEEAEIPYEDRVERIKRILSNRIAPQVSLVAIEKCMGRSHLFRKLKRTLKRACNLP
jgi:hypothetical protein